MFLLFFASILSYILETNSINLVIGFCIWLVLYRIYDQICYHRMFCRLLITIRDVFYHYQASLILRKQKMYLVYLRLISTKLLLQSCIFMVCVFSLFIINKILMLQYLDSLYLQKIAKANK